MNKGIIQGIFPTPLGVYELGRDITQTELSTVKELDYETNEDNYISKNRNVLSLWTLKGIRRFIEESLEDYLAQAYVVNHATLYLTQSWTNRASLGEFHKEHEHPNSVISGVMYFGGNGSDKIEFYGERNFMFQLKHEQKDMGKFNSNLWWMPTTQGTLYFFPSHLRHAVPKVQDTNVRYSLAFNTFIKGELGREGLATHLVI